MTGRKEVDTNEATVTYLSMEAFHMTIVPPVVLDLVRATSWSYLSSLFSSQQYSPRKSDMQLLRSEVKMLGSLIKIKSGIAFSEIFFKLTKFRFIPSKFHVSDVNNILVACEGLLEAVPGDDVEVGGVVDVQEVAPTILVRLSVQFSLTDSKVESPFPHQ